MPVNLTVMSVKIGKIRIGDNHPVVVQSMTNTGTNDVEATIDQCIRIADAGGKIIRITVQNFQEIESLRRIREELFILGYDFPLVADVHFNPKIASEAAKIVEKVRINPGNYTERKLPADNSQYNNSLPVFSNDIFKSLLDICKERGTAIRIGVNHGSLSERIMNRYGDTPEGMAESAMEFIRICFKESFKNLIVSMKASNTRIMIYSTRLLDAKMKEEDMIYPLHLGVTEAGSGVEGRIRSAVGIAALLQEGIGDTIRVSLTEDPEEEIPVAKELSKYFSRKKDKIPTYSYQKELITSFNRRKTYSVLTIGGDNPPVVISSLDTFLRDDCVRSPGSFQIPDFIYSDTPPDRESPYANTAFLVPCKNLKSTENPGFYPVGTPDEYREYFRHNSGPFFLFVRPMEIIPEDLERISKDRNIVLIADCLSSPTPDILLRFFSLLEKWAPEVPVIIKKNFNLKNTGQFILRAAGETGLFFIDGLADGIWLENNGQKMPLITYSFEILQASRARISSTEFISCPSCGRTQFDIKKVLQTIKGETSHLTGLKIAVMGCIVNGPGEMADADYGYVGAGPGKITLYRGKKPVIKNVPEDEAIHYLIKLIKKDGNWRNP